MKQKNKKITIVGFGYIGCIIGSYLASQGYCVTGIELNDHIIKSINNGFPPFHEPGLAHLVKAGIDSRRLTITKECDAIKESDVILVTVGSPLNDSGDADLNHLSQAFDRIKPYLQKDQLLILKSTLPPGTSRDFVWPQLSNKNLLLAFCPERLAEGRALADLTTLPVIIGGINQEAALAASQFWIEALNVEIIIVENTTTAELVKLADNLWVDVNIALGNELAKISDKLNIDVLEVIAAANTLKKNNSNVNILLPSLGVGGYCLTKDPWFLHAMGNRLGIDLKIPAVSRKVNESMPEYSVCLIDRYFQNLSKKSEEISIGVLGLSFKNNTSDCRFTPTKPAIEKLLSLGYTVRIYDPLLTQEDAFSLTGIEMSSSISDCVTNVDCVAYFAGHDEIINFSLENLLRLTNKNALIFDGRRFFNKTEINNIKSLGFTYKGVGRI